ncbi:MAG: protein kinase [Gemmatimonadota bacterium]
MSTDPDRPDTRDRPAQDAVVWERWAEVDALLEQLLDMPEARWETYLAGAHREDPDLVAAALALARESIDTGPDLGPGDRIVDAALREAGPEDEEEPDPIGGRVGAYRIVSELGAGGMGWVFAAERDDETFERQVAIKIIKRSVASRDVLARFALERQILASLDHVAIAQLLDGGVTRDGRPYLVMERVEGERIDRWADRHRLGVDARLRLVLQVMEAVEHAHRHMVIHRDLKPSNILVREDGTVKLLDFGIAKLIDHPTAGAGTTRTGRRFLTPEYAAPEQLLGEPASAQTDIYSVGILLYELLTGSRPYEGGAQGSVLEQVVRGEQPTAPSAAVPPVDTRGGPAGQAGVGQDAVYSARSTTPEALRRRLRGDIDAVLMRSLRARPSERYSTMAAFRDDVERHLAGHAVHARGDARAYRIRKFVGRHRWSVAAASGALLLLSGSALGLALQRGRLIEQTEIAQAATAEAEREAETARATTDFLVGLFEANAPTERLGDTLTARALLDRGIARVDEQLEGQPEVRAELLRSLGRVHMSMGLQEEALPLLERAVALVRDSTDDAAPILASMLSSLGAALDVYRDYDRAESAYREAVVAALEARDTTALAWARIGLGSALSRQERPDEAEVELRAGLALRAFEPGDEEQVWRAQRVLSSIVRRQGDLEGADSLLLAVVEGRRSSPGELLSYTRSLNDLAVVRRLRGQYPSAEALYEEAIDSATTIFGPAHPETLQYRANLITTLAQGGNVEGSLREQRAVIEDSRSMWPDGHWRTARSLMALGGALIRSGRPDEAVPALSEAVDMGIEQMGMRHSWTNVYRAWLGVAAALTDRSEQAEQFWTWSLEGLEAYEALQDDASVASMVEVLVATMREQGLESEAVPFARLLGD